MFSIIWWQLKCVILWRDKLNLPLFLKSHFMKGDASYAIKKISEHWYTDIYQSIDILKQNSDMNLWSSFFFFHFLFGPHGQKLNTSSTHIVFCRRKMYLPWNSVKPKFTIFFFFGSLWLCDYLTTNRRDLVSNGPSLDFKLVLT